MSLFEDRSCGCGPAPHPVPPQIPAGLAELSDRQAAGFPDYRAAMLSAIPRYVALADWRARGEGDLGVMLIDAWAYVLDVTAFYDARIAERAFIGTAPDAEAASGLAALLGHRLRGAIASRVRLALDADGADPVFLPKGTAFRSAAFGNEPPQVFELDFDLTIWPQRNRWRLAPIRADAFDGVLRFLTRAAPPAGAVVLVTAGSNAGAARIESVISETGPDGAKYQRALLENDAPIAALAGAPLSSLEVAILRLPLAPSAFGTAFTPLPATNQAALILDAIYTQIRPGDRAAVEIGGVLRAVRIDAVAVTTVEVDEESGARQAATRVTFSPTLTLPSGQTPIFHGSPFRLGAPSSSAKTEFVASDLLAGAELLPPIAPLTDAPLGGDFILVGRGEQGVLVGGTIEAAADGTGRLQPAMSTSDFPNLLATPVELLGNVVEAVRGETVVDEVLGSGDASTPFNRFLLAKKPLTWREDASRPDGRRPDLDIRVNGVRWARVDSFFGRGPKDEIYVARHQPNGSTSVTFGDGVRGARPPTGVNNVRADYRFGAGAAKPPPGAIDQLARRVKGLAAVRGPLAATGGADAETAEALRTAAPARALTLGRAVSLADFEALARGFGGVVNVQARWAWDERRQAGGVKLWVIAEGGLEEQALADWLTRQGPPDLRVVVETAEPAPFDSLDISLTIDPRHAADEVRRAAFAALFDFEGGLLSPAVQRIGAPLFRSTLTLALHRVAGIASVRAILLEGLPMPAAVAPGIGRWFDLEPGTSLV